MGVSEQPFQHLSIRFRYHIHRPLHDRQIERLHMRVVRQVNVGVPSVCPVRAESLAMFISVS